MQNRAGFTLIELIIVIIIIGILVAVGIPKFIQVGGTAKQTVTNSVAHALNTASQSNYSLYKTGLSTAVAIANCTDVANALPSSNKLPSGFTITSQAITSNASVTCTLTHPDGVITSTFIGKGT